MLGLFSFLVYMFPLIVKKNK